VLIGGIAATLYGSRHVTDDTDVLVRRTTANLNRLRRALIELDARDLRKRSLDEVMADLAEGGNARTRTAAGPLDWRLRDRVCRVAPARRHERGG